MDSFNIHLEKDKERWVKGTLTVKGNVYFGTNFTFWIEGLAKDKAVITTTGSYVHGSGSPYWDANKQITSLQTFWKKILHENLIPTIKQKNVQNTSKLKKGIREYSFLYHLPLYGSSDFLQIERYYLRAKLIRHHMLDKNFKKRIKVKQVKK